MSYCRWSSDDHQCDVYCYEDVMGGYSLHVASNKVIFRQPLPLPIEFAMENIDALVERMKTVSELLQSGDRRPIGLKFDGKSFNFPSPEETADFMVELKNMGYRVPQYAIDALREEASENAEAEKSAQE